jgi:hypothetical protein
MSHPEDGNLVVRRLFAKMCVDMLIRFLILYSLRKVSAELRLGFLFSFLWHWVRFSFISVNSFVRTSIFAASHEILSVILSCVRGCENDVGNTTQHACPGGRVLRSQGLSQPNASCSVLVAFLPRTSVTTAWPLRTHPSDFRFVDHSDNLF